MKRKFNSYDYQGKAEKQLESSNRIFFYCFAVLIICLTGYGLWSFLEWISP